MGYDVVYTITIIAPNDERRLKLAKQVILCASNGSDEPPKSIYHDHRDELKPIREGGSVMVIQRRGWFADRDFHGKWYDSATGKIRLGLHPRSGEKFLFEVEGDDDDDRWRAEVKKYSYRVEYAKSIKYVEKEDGCGNDDGENKCKGCSACAIVVPIYEDE